MSSKIYLSRLAFESFFGKPTQLSENTLLTQTSGPDTLKGKRDCKLCLQGVYNYWCKT